ncbi:MAG: FtsX-like permease family protein [Deltaproteobacteria bacterium]|nr:FtsX-like permease family protein [Deltaproteobacteria bacterium]
MAIPVSYNLRNCLQRPVSTLTTAVAVGLTVLIFVGALALASGFQAALTATGSDNNIMILRKGADSEVSSALTRDTVNIIRAHDAVAQNAEGRPLASPEVVVMVVKDRLGQTGSSNVLVRGIDPEALALRDNVKIVNGRMFSPGADEVIVGKLVADRFVGFNIGDTVRFGQQTVTVAGHFEAGGSSFESEVWGDNAVLMPAFRGEVFQTMTFRMKDPSRFEEVKKEMEADPRLQVDVKRESEFYAAQSELLANLLRFLGVFITIVMGVGAVFGAMNTMYAMVGTRLREIATMLVLGFRPIVVMLSFMIEAVLISLFGGVLGCLAALPINGIVTSTTNFASFSEVAFAFKVTPQSLFYGMIVAGLLGLAGGFFPALRAARQPLVEGLRGG